MIDQVLTLKSSTLDKKKPPMGKWKYRKPEPSHIRGVCCKCGVNPQKKKSNGKYNTLCSPCDSRMYEKNRHKYRKKYYFVERSHCSKCGFTPEHVCQLDVDHIDGNNKNNDPENLRVLCANCHRLKTYLSRDWEPSS